MSGPNRSKTARSWLRYAPTWSCMTRPSSALMRASSMSMCPVNARASSAVAAPRRARAKIASASVGARGAVKAVSTPWSVAVAPIERKKPRRSSSADTSPAAVSDLAPDRGRKGIEPGPPAGCQQVDDAVRTERRAHVAGPAAPADRGVVRQRVGRVVGRAQRLDARALEDRARPVLGPAQLVVQLVVDRLGVGAAQRLANPEHDLQRVRQPDPGRCAPEQVKVVGERLPDPPLVRLRRRSGGSLVVARVGLAARVALVARVARADPQRLERDPLRVEHPEDVVVGDDEELGRRAERGVLVGEQARINVAVRADDRELRDRLVELARHASLPGVGREESIGRQEWRQRVHERPPDAPRW